ncbi:hypothetical protein [Edaphobacter aggregans]|uniref:hypothetical protein n=1 Tax=Edaphobacter aggregans TaxID=570835 RepID=UPI0012FC625A|nr:hypothetical protein [Edaphobacter aggregans]
MSESIQKGSGGGDERVCAGDGAWRERRTVEVGKCADMVLLDADPLADIHNMRRIVKSIEGGAVYDPAPLWESVGFKP